MYRAARVCAGAKDKWVPDFPSLAQDCCHEQTVRSSLLVCKGTMGKLSELVAQREIQEMLLVPEASPHLQRKNAADRSPQVPGRSSAALGQEQLGQASQASEADQNEASLNHSFATLPRTSSS